MRNDGIILVVIVSVVAVISSESLFKKGSYKSHKKGNKVAVNEVPHIDSRIFPDTKYLKIKAKIDILKFGSVKNFQNLENIRLEGCEITDIIPGAFTDVPNLKIIALNDNLLKGIKSGVFNSLNITTLYLHRNSISYIETEAFDNITDLKQIKLNANSLSFWDNNWFKNTPSLTKIFFRRNLLRSLPSKAFKNFNDIQNRKKLKIYLSKNLISSIQLDAFYGLSECSQIWLDRNEISELQEGVFAQMQFLEVLFLSSNFLTSLPKNLLAGVKSELLTLDLAHNNNLTCLDYEIVAKVKITNLEKINKLDCDCVEKLNGKIVRDGKSNEINSDC